VRRGAYEAWTRLKRRDPVGVAPRGLALTMNR